PQTPLDVRLRRRRVDRASISPSGRGRNALLRDRRLRHPRRSCGDRSRPRFDGPGADPGGVVGGASPGTLVSWPARSTRFALYIVGFLLMAASGFALAVSARGFLASTRLLWLSAGMSAAAIIAAAASILWRPGSSEGP